MMRALYSAVSGLASHMLRMDVIGNNIANVNTTGFKAGRITFAETFAQMQRAATGPGATGAGANPIQVGCGSTLGSASQLYTQGSLQVTGVGTDLAIQGNGMFVLSDGATTYYTRDGAFQLDAAGQLVSPTSGAIVQGYLYDRASETFGTELTKIQIPLNGVEPASETTLIELAGNLNADSQPLGSLLETSALYTADGSYASGTTALVDLRLGSSSTTTLVAAGDTIHLDGMIGGETVSAELAVAAETTLDDLAVALEDVLNSPDDVDGVTVTVDAQGRLSVETPDALGTSAGVDYISLSAVDSEGNGRSEFVSALGFSSLEDARDASSFTKTTQVYDALGFAHNVTLTFTRVTGENEFTWTAAVDSTGASILEGGSGRVSFRDDGSIESFRFDNVGADTPTALHLSPGTGARGPLVIAFDCGGQGSFEGLTMLDGATGVESNQNGAAQGVFMSFETDEYGLMTARFSNGVLRPLAQLAVAEFINPAGLTRVGNNAYIENPNTGSPVFGAPGGGIVSSTITSGALEQSNVDLAQEFTDMVVTQRGFQANARVITTSDEMLTDLINSRR
jgi:flagellar hook protein FlgE